MWLKENILKVKVFFNAKGRKKSNLVGISLYTVRFACLHTYKGKKLEYRMGRTYIITKVSFFWDHSQDMSSSGFSQKKCEPLIG